MEDTPNWAFRLTLAFSILRPLLVVITITPFEARAPYMEVEEASLSTDILSMSAGLIVLKSDAEIATPSSM